jgi:intracellular multiplication protein IcmE|tara:strand:- start:60521 stop:61999 length:1479 start_codon:yes stop_codon:yes gene_type:complete
MSNEDQFDDEFEGVDEFDSDADFQSGQSIKELWRKNPMFKFGVIIVGLVVIIISVNIFGSDDVKIENSAISTGQSSNVRGAVGEEVTDTYREALETRNQQDFEEAVEDQDSFVPVPVDPIKTVIAPTAREVDEKEDPMAQWKELQEKRMRRQEDDNKRRRLMEIQNQRAMAAMPRQEDPNKDARKQALGKLSNAMMEQMAMVAQRHEYRPMDRMSVTSEEAYYNGLAYRQQSGMITNGNTFGTGAGVNNANGMNGMQTTMMEEEEPLIVPGDILYSQLLIEANSDVPAVVMARVLTGHFEGSKILGSFSREDEHIVLSFDKIIKDGKTYPVNGVAVDPETSLPGLATEVDHRYFKRIFLPAASKFIEGVAEAVTEGGTTSVISSTTGETVAQETEDLDLNQELLKGVSEASTIVTDLLLEEGEDTEILVRVAAGTPMGILFVDAVYESSRIGAPGANLGGVSPFGASSAAPMNTAGAVPAGFDPSSLNLLPR